MGHHNNAITMNRGTQISRKRLAVRFPAMKSPPYLTKTCHVVACLLCFGIGLSAFCLKKNNWIDGGHLSLSLKWGQPSKEKKNSGPCPGPEWIKCMFIRHPWPYPRVLAFGVILLHPLQGVDTETKIYKPTFHLICWMSSKMWWFLAQPSPKSLNLWKDCKVDVC